MKIEYFGHSCFRISSEDGVCALTDPYTGVGYSLPTDLSADIVTVSHGHFDHNYTAAVKGKYALIDQAGEYVEKGVIITGIPSAHDSLGGALRGKNIIFKMKMDGMTVCHLGDLGEPCSDELIAKLGKIDVLLLPVGGNYTIDAMQAKDYVAQIRPKIAIPMHYRPQEGTIDISPAESFLLLFDGVRALGDNPLEISCLQLNGEKTEIIYMERRKDV